MVLDDREMAALDPEHRPTGGELELLNGFLDYYRAVVARKVSGLDRRQLALTVAPSDLTLAGLIKHLAHVEDVWFAVRLGGLAAPEPWASADWDADPDWDLNNAGDDDPAELLALHAAACDRSRSVVDDLVARHGDGALDVVSVVANRRGQTFNARWILIHVVEEYARHAGHADLIRQTIDGATGD